MTARFPQEHLCANDKPPPPVGTPVSSRLSDQLAPTHQHQPTHAPPFIKSRQTVQPLKKITCHLKISSLDDWEKEWGKNSQRSLQPKLPPVDFRSPLVPLAQAN
jgi:hypothetical protein